MNDEGMSSQDGCLIATFALGKARFGVDAQLVQEVVKVGEITQVHQAPPYVAGIRNLRGRIVTVVDLALLLNLGAVTESADARLLIMECEGEPIGFLVDSVTEAIALKEDEVAPPPANLDAAIRRNLRGVWRTGDQLIAILDAQAFLREHETNDTAMSPRSGGS